MYACDNGPIQEAVGLSTPPPLLTSHLHCDTKKLCIVHLNRVSYHHLPCICWSNQMSLSIIVILTLLGGVTCLLGVNLRCHDRQCDLAKLAFSAKRLIRILFQDLHSAPIICCTQYQASAALSTNLQHMTLSRIAHGTIPVFLPNRLYKPASLRARVLHWSS